MKHMYMAALLLMSHVMYAQVGINTTTPSSASVLDVSSSNDNINYGGFMPPRVTLAQRNAIAVTAADDGLMVFLQEGTTRCVQVYNGVDTQWDDVYCMPIVAVPGTLLTELFEDDGNGGVRYTTSATESISGADFFSRVTAGTVDAGYTVTGPEGTTWFAVEDMDAVASTTETLTFNAVLISGLSNFTIRLLIAEDDDGASQDWDATDSFSIEYSVDGGAFTKVFAVENDGTPFNTAPAQDTNLDGDGEGTEVTDTFAEFSTTFSTTGTSLVLRLVFDNLDANDEDISIDNIRLEGI